MLQNYIPILIFLAIALVIGVVPIIAGLLLGRRIPEDAKDSPYECGFDVFDDSHMRFDVRFYLVAILFIIFDLEIAFLFPWAVALRDIGLPGLLAMAVFLGVLIIGFIYEWKKGALNWD